MSEIRAKKTLIGSIHKSLDNATLTGKLKLKNLFLLNVINKYLYSCDSVLTFLQSEYLKNLAIAIENTDKNICLYREQLSNYTNIVGCRNCTPLNANNVIVINTPPEVDNGPVLTPVECLYPTIVDNVLPDYCGMSALKITLNMLIQGSFYDFEGLNTNYKNLKITKLPTYGVLMLNGQPVVLNQVIDLVGYVDELAYVQVAESEEELALDYFEFQISSVAYPNCYSNIAFKELTLCSL